MQTIANFLLVERRCFLASYKMLKKWIQSLSKDLVKGSFSVMKW
jgi:hypothetical protein